MKRESGIRNMTAGSPLRHILVFTLPLLAGNFLQQFYNMVDSWVVGNFVSDAALAAVGVGFPVIFLFTSLFSGIATGGTVVIAQAFGAGKPDRVRSAIDSLYTAFVRSILPIPPRRRPAFTSWWCARALSAASAIISTPVFWAAWATAPPRCCFWRCPPF